MLKSLFLFQIQNAIYLWFNSFSVTLMHITIFLCFATICKKDTLYHPCCCCCCWFCFFTLKHNSACNLPMHSGFLFRKKCTNEGKKSWKMNLNLISKCFFFSLSSYEQLSITSDCINLCDAINVFWNIFN